MNKTDLVDSVAQRTGESRAAAQRMVEAVIGAIVDGVREDQRVSIPRFGTFLRKHRKARTVRNPATSAPIEIKACTVLGFTASATLRNGV